MSEVRTINKNQYPVGTVCIPPSKSISHRAVICAVLSGQTSENLGITNLGQSQDITATLKAITQIVNGDNKENIDCAESGSTLRFLIPIAAMSDKEWTFTGRGRLLDRPQEIYEDIFRKQNLVFEKSDNKIKVKGPIRAGSFTIPGDVSSQFITGMMYALSLADGDSEISLSTPLESKDYVNLTIETMSNYGVIVTKVNDDNGNLIGYKIKGGQKYQPVDFVVEGDYSQSAFFLGAAALGKDVTVAGLNENSAQGDRGVIDVLKKMGAELTFSYDENNNNTLLKVVAPNGGLVGTVIDAKDIPDIIPPLAAVACYAKGTTKVINAGRLRIKESDRLHALAVELKKLGADIEEEEEGLIINGKNELAGGEVDSHNDHRIAMSIALASIGCAGEVVLSGSESVSKSYPHFWSDWNNKYEAK